MHHRWDSSIHTEGLKYLKQRQLWDLLGDDETLLCTARNNPKFQELQRQKEVLCTSNRKLAQQNLSYQPYLKYKKALLAERYQLLSQLITSERHKQKKSGKCESQKYRSIFTILLLILKHIDRLNGHLSLKATHQLLKEKLVHLTHESESLGQKFMEGKMLLVDFVDSFQSIQKFYHVHLVQLEKLQDVYIQTMRNRRKEVFSSDQTTPGVMNMFYSTSPSIILPCSIFPLIGYPVKPPFLPRLSHYAHADLCLPLMHKNNAGNSQEFKKTWPQSEGQLQYFKKD
ncbi:vacuolar protein sorting-associated protein 37B-like [Tachysurus fulvidraco]|uniref:vacuolar protein sorting-associated protein 37B-like n=1 Tax=Tachysurus fulvidraco TaxID=1234273 RepID=UPI001FEFE573|nr:vacuolar protein sorting-associated protein 37B-like [Tachysurus fulvidraco]